MLFESTCIGDIFKSDLFNCKEILNAYFYHMEMSDVIFVACCQQEVEMTSVFDQISRFDEATYSKIMLSTNLIWAVTLCLQNSSDLQRLLWLIERRLHQTEQHLDPRTSRRNDRKFKNSLALFRCMLFCNACRHFRILDFSKNVQLRSWSRSFWAMPSHITLKPHRDWLDLAACRCHWNVHKTSSKRLYNSFQFGLENQQKDTSSVGSSNAMVVSYIHTPVNSPSIIVTCCKFLF